LSQWRLR
ncbi:hypothetical protein ECEC1870_4258, partial [Escherichia coli EC1870]